ncbi:hypothetical protein HRG_006967 [Hirsutella rhossiliensis]|uniref:Uncharacterized protein n=1 Tax=Hirsutella rhossiliensis TaxID=111463 RepID=A0A9P8MZC0_9HYPO|nr:uncharacterized protein HRG_06967 [Hirsutella rhossiliensis]KAH0961887.1 hypothetical protein HRG_06967 [Hirsutella rhossiliensis]
MNPQNQAGATFADAIHDTFPNIAAALHRVQACDCSSLASMLQNPTDDMYKNQVEALCQAAESAMDHFINQNAHLERRIAELETHLAQAQGTPRTQDSLVTLADELRTLLSARPTELRPEPRPRRMMPNPNPFEGDEKDVKKRQLQYVNWRSQVLRAFAVDKSFFATDFIRIQHIAGLLGGSASKLYRKKFDFIIEHEENQAIWPWQTHTDCLAEMNKQYETLDLTLSASQAFDNLWMGKKPFQNFIADFAALAEECGKTETQKVESLQLKVSQELANEMTHQLVRPARDNFSEWCKMYQTIYDNLLVKDHQDKLRSTDEGGLLY